MAEISVLVENSAKPQGAVTESERAEAPFFSDHMDLKHVPYRIMHVQKRAQLSFEEAQSKMGIPSNGF